MSDSLRPHGLQPTRLLCPWGFSRQQYWSGLPCPPPGNLPNLGIKLRSPTLQAYSLPSEPPGKPMKIGVGSLSLLQGIFLTQDSNWGLLQCRQILCQLSYQGAHFSLYIEPNVSRESTLLSPFPCFPFLLQSIPRYLNKIVPIKFHTTNHMCSVCQCSSHWTSQ